MGRHKDHSMKRYSILVVFFLLIGIVSGVTWISDTAIRVDELQAENTEFIQFSNRTVHYSPYYNPYENETVNVSYMFGVDGYYLEEFGDEVPAFKIAPIVALRMGGSQPYYADPLDMNAFVMDESGNILMKNVGFTSDSMAIGKNVDDRYTVNGIAIGDNANIGGYSVSLPDGCPEIGGGEILAHVVSSGCQELWPTGPGFTTYGYEYPIAIGYNATAIYDYTLALGFNSNATAINAIAIGSNSKSTDDYALAIGYYALASAEGAISIGGEDAEATGINAIAIGNYTYADGFGSIAIGDAAYSEVNGSIAIGQYADAGAINAIALGTNTLNTVENSFKVGGDINSTMLDTNLEVTGDVLLNQGFNAQDDSLVNGTLYVANLSVATGWTGACNLTNATTLTVVNGIITYCG